MPEEDVEQLLVSLILDNRIQGHIDQVNRLLERGDRSIFIFEPLIWFDHGNLYYHIIIDLGIK